jgi:peptidoglycan hydrolase FlgJ
MDSALQSIGDTAVSQATASKMAVGANTNIDKAANDFEGMFLTQMLQPMFETVPVDSEFGGGHGEEVMRSFLVQEYGKIVAKSGTINIAAAVKNEMIRAQNISTATSQTSGTGGLNGITH